jgi:hypothetical protein
MRAKNSIAESAALVSNGVKLFIWRVLKIPRLTVLKLRSYKP